MKTIAYLRVSKDSQDVRNQRLAILEFAQQEKLEISEFMELSMSSRRSSKERQIDLLMTQLESGDTLIVSELSRMGRSVGEIITTVDALVKQRIRFMAIKEGRLFLDSRVLADQQLNERAQQRFTPLSHVVNELEETQVERQFLLPFAQIWR